MTEMEDSSCEWKGLSMSLLIEPDLGSEIFRAELYYEGFLSFLREGLA